MAASAVLGALLAWRAAALASNASQRWQEDAHTYISRNNELLRDYEQIMTDFAPMRTAAEQSGTLFYSDRRYGSASNVLLNAEARAHLNAGLDYEATFVRDADRYYQRQFGGHDPYVHYLNDHALKPYSSITHLALMLSASSDDPAHRDVSNGDDFVSAAKNAKTFTIVTALAFLRACVALDTRSLRIASAARAVAAAGCLISLTGLLASISSTF
jgi:hypothetical protein